MKKPKHPSLWEEDDEISSENGKSLHEDMLDEDIIDLEDIVETSGEEADAEDSPDVHVETLDLESDLDFGDVETDKGPAKTSRGDRDRKGGMRPADAEFLEAEPFGDAGLLENDSDDILKDFSFTEEDEGKEESGADVEMLRKKMDDSLGGLIVSDEEDEESDLISEKDLLATESDEDLVDFAFPEDEGDEELKEDMSFLDGMQKETDEDLPDLLLAEVKPVEPELGAKKEALVSVAEVTGFESLPDLEKELRPAGEERTMAATREDAAKPDLGLPLEAFGESESALDAVVSRLEGRLVETLGEIVEARLPDIVRKVLREEIEKLKKELT